MVVEIFNGKTIIVTGHTGFKGSWLSIWLSQLGAKVIGISDRVPTDPSHYELIKKNITKDLRINIKDPDAVFSVINDLQPDYVFHLAALADIVPSIDYPELYYASNVNGTFNVIEACRRAQNIKKIVYSASSSCYGIPQHVPTNENAEIKTVPELLIL